MTASVAGRIRKRLGEFTRDVENGVVIQDKYTCRRIDVDFKPTQHNPKSVKQTRRILNASQAVFAMFLGVSVKTVQAWEQGVSPPPRMACRFMDEIRHDPAHWIERLEAAISPK